jgi:Tat protein secretion system quality control protein TatD with DNase activity
MENRHPRIEEIIKSLALGNIILETDAPHLKPSDVPQTYNSCNIALSVARHISELQDVSLGDVLRKTTRNATNLYRLTLNTSQ